MLWTCIKRYSSFPPFLLSFLPFILPSLNLLTIWFLPLLVRMTLKAIHRILWTWTRVTETLDVHWMCTALYTGHTLDCTLHSGMCPWTVHQVYTGLYTRCAFELCTRCVQLCSRCAYGLCARYVQLCSSCSPDVSSCVPDVFQL